MRWAVAAVLVAAAALTACGDDDGAPSSGGERDERCTNALVRYRPTPAHAVTGVEIDATSRAVPQWERWEASVRLDPAPANPFDPEEVDVRVAVVDPEGERRDFLAFWYQDHERALVDGREQLTPTGEPEFRVRITVDRAGPWVWWWSIGTPEGETVLGADCFVVGEADGRGFLRVSERDDRYLAHDDGTPYFAVGENLAWYDGRGTYAYDEWLGALEEQDANFARLWMPSWAFGLEWDDTGLGDYTERLDRAWQLDRVLDEAGRRGIAVELSLLNHGAYSLLFNSEWEHNPYNAANGGPLATPKEFFTDAEARALFERRLRYVVARWGYAPNLLAWELWNEVDLTDGHDSEAVAAWHRDMAGLLRELDPYDHLVTTSHAIRSLDPVVWDTGGLDFTQLHFYATSTYGTEEPDISRDVVDWTAERRAVTGRPVLFAELGVDSRGPAETKAADPDGIGVHDGLWAGVVSGGFGTAMTWWWDNLIAVEPDRYYPMFGAVARFVDGVRWDAEDFEAPAPSDGLEVRSAAAPTVRVHALLGRDTGLVWLKDAARQWNTPVGAEVTDAELRLTLDGRWCGRWYDTWAGEWGAELEVDTAAALRVPAFVGDVALRLERCGA